MVDFKLVFKLINLSSFEKAIYKPKDERKVIKEKFGVNDNLVESYFQQL